MKKLFLTLIVTAGLLFNACAQKLNIGLNLAGAMPLGNFGDATDFGFGGDISLDYYFNDLFDLGIETGFKAFPYSSSAMDGESIGIIPIQLTAGLHQDIDDWIDLYGEVGGGAFITTMKAASFSINGVEYESVSETYGGISPRIGVAFELSPLWFLDVNVNYTHVFTEGDALNWVGINAGLLYTIAEY